VRTTVPKRTVVCCANSSMKVTVHWGAVLCLATMLMELF
jgi:hypothetical protein